MAVGFAKVMRVPYTERCSWLFDSLEITGGGGGGGGGGAAEEEKEEEKKEEEEEEEDEVSAAASFCRNLAALCLKLLCASTGLRIV